MKVKCDWCGEEKEENNFYKQREGYIFRKCKNCLKKDREERILSREHIAHGNTKVCTVCKTEKQIIEFNKKHDTIDGYRSRCKSCDKNYKKKIIETKKIYPETKICSQCKTEKPSSEFHKKAENKDGLRCECKVCNKLGEIKRSSKIKSYRARYIQINKVILRENKKRKTKKRMKIDPVYRARTLFCAQINRWIKKEGQGTKNILPYSLDEYVEHLRTTIPNGYTWEDFMQGNLEIDHIIPQSAYRFIDFFDADFIKCWDKKNLQLLPCKENASKGGKILMDLIKEKDITHLLPEGYNA